MSGGSIPQWESFERLTPTLFLVGGTLVVGHAAIRGIEAFTEMAPPPDMFGPLGYLITLLGLLGLYPALVDRTPTLARITAIVAVIPFLGWVVISAVTFAKVAGILSSQATVLPGGFYMIHIFLVVLMYLLFGVSSLQAGVHSRTLSFLLLVPPLLFIVLMTGAATLGNFAVGSFIIGSGQALVHLSIGGILYADTPKGSHVPRGDVTGG